MKHRLLSQTSAVLMAVTLLLAAATNRVRADSASSNSDMALPDQMPYVTLGDRL